jgi:hypothetical protein
MSRNRSRRVRPCPPLAIYSSRSRHSMHGLSWWLVLSALLMFALPIVMSSGTTESVAPAVPRSAARLATPKRTSSAAIGADAASGVAMAGEVAAGPVSPPAPSASVESRDARAATPSPATTVTVAPAAAPPAPVGRADLAASHPAASHPPRARRVRHAVQVRPGVRSRVTVEPADEAPSTTHSLIPR